MTKIQFELDGKQVEAVNGETIWQVAKRQGREIPHLCHSPEPDYRPDGNCRACMVEVEGHRADRAQSPRRKGGWSFWSPTSRRARRRTIPIRSSGTGPKRSRSPKAAS